MNLGTVSVVGDTFVGLTGGHVEGATDFFVEEDIAHGVFDLVIEGNGELADESGAGIGIEDLVDFLGFVGGGVDDFSFLELEANIVEGNALVDGGGVEVDLAIDGVFDGRREDFAVRDVVGAVGHESLEAFDAEFEVGAVAFDVDVFGLVHEAFEGAHSGHEFFVIEEADFEVEIFEGLGAHSGLLRHGGVGPAEDAPTGFVNALVKDGAHFCADELHVFGGDIGEFGDVMGAANGNVGVHSFHLGKGDLGNFVVLRFGGTEVEFPDDGGLMDIDVGIGFRFTDGAN